MPTSLTLSFVGIAVFSLASHCDCLFMFVAFLCLQESIQAKNGSLVEQGH